MLRGLEPKTRVRTRDDDCSPCETGCGHGWHFEDLAVEELVDFGEVGHGFAFVCLFVCLFLFERI